MTDVLRIAHLVLNHNTIFPPWGRMLDFEIGLLEEDWGEGLEYEVEGLILSF